MRSTNSNAETINSIYPDPKVCSILQNIKNNIEVPRQLEIQLYELAEFLDHSHSKHRINASFVLDNNVDGLIIQAIDKHSSNDLIIFVASCKCLISIIMYSPDDLQIELVNKLMKSEIFGALHITLTKLKGKNSPQTIKVILSLIQRMLTICDNIQNLTEKTIFDDCDWIVEDENLQNDIRIQAIEILQTFLEISQNKFFQAKYYQKMTNILQKEIENKNRQITIATLKFVKQLQPSNVKNISLNSTQLSIFARILNTFPEDKDIKSICTQFFSHLPIEEEAAPIIQNLKEGKFDKIMLFNIVFLRNEAIDLCVSKGVINRIHSALETMLTNLPVNHELISAGLIALTRIADISDKYAIEIMSHRGIELLEKLCGIQDPEIIQRTCECLHRLVINDKAAETIAAFLDILIQNARSLKTSDEGVLRSLALLVNKLAQQKANLKPGMEENIVSVINLVFCVKPKDKLLNILSLDFLSQLKIETLLSLNASTVMSYMKHITCLYPGWAKARVLAFDVIAKIYEHKDRLELTHSERSVMDVLISFLANRFEKESLDIIREEYFESFELRFDYANDGLTDSAESMKVEMLQRIINPVMGREKLDKFKDSYQRFVDKHGKNEAIDLVLTLEFIGKISCVADLANIIIKEQIPQRVFEIVEISSKSENIFVKETLLRACALFFENMSESKATLVNNQDLQKTALSVLFYILDTKITKPTLMQGLHTIKALLASGLLSHNSKVIVMKQEVGLETILNLSFTRINSFGEDHTLKELGIGILKTALDTNKLENIIKTGGVRFCISVIENLKAPFSLFAKTLSLIDMLLENKEALILFAQNEAYDKIIQFLRQNIVLTKTFEIAKKPLEKLAKAQKAKESKAFIEELLETLASQELDENGVAETLKEILCLSIIEENTKLVLEKRGLLILMSQIQKDISSDYKGKRQEEIKLHTVALNAGIAAIYQLCVYARKSDDFSVKDEIMKIKFIKTLFEVLFYKQSTPEIIVQTLQLIVLLTENTELREILIQECLTEDSLENLVSAFKMYKEDIRISGLLADFSSQIVKSSKEITLRLGQGFCIRSLLNEITSVLRSYSVKEDQDFDRISINLRCLQCIAIHLDNANKIIEMEGLDIIIQLLSCSQIWADLGLELLSNMASHESLVVKLFNKDLLEILQAFLKSYTDSKLMLKSLYLLRKACNVEKHKDYLIKHDLLSQILNINASFPSNEDTQLITAELIEVLGGHILIPLTGEQFIAVSQQLNLNDQDLIKQYIHCGLNLVSLFTTKEIGDREENMPIKVIESIDKTLPLFKANMELVTVQILLMKKLVNKDPTLKEQLINSTLLDLIVNDVLGNEKFNTFDHKTKIEVLEFVQCFAVRREHNKIIDGTTGEEIVLEDEINAFLYAFIEGTGHGLRNLLAISNDLEASQESLLAIEILTGLVSSHKDIATEIVRKEEVKLGFSYWMEKSDNVKGDNSSIRGLSLLKELAKIPEASKEILENSAFRNFVEKLKEYNGAATETKILIGILEIVKNVSNSINLNRIALNDFKLIETLIGFVKQFTQHFKENMPLIQSIADSMRAIRNLIQDPLLARTFIRKNGLQTAFALIRVIASAAPAEESRIDLEELNQLSDLTSSSSHLNQAIEETLSVIEMISRRNKYSSHLSLITDDPELYQSLLNMVSSRIDDPILGLHALKIFQQRLMTMTREDLLDNLELFMPICDLVDSLMEVYPNIEIINKYGNSLKGLICSGMGSLDHQNEESNLLCQEKVQNIAQNINASQDTNLQSIESLCELLDTLEDLLSRNDVQELSEDEYLGFMIAVSTLRDLMNENSIAEVMRRYGAAYNLGGAILSETIDEDTRNYMLQILQMIFAGKFNSEDDQLSQTFIEDIAKYITNLVEKGEINKSSNLELALETVKGFLQNLQRPTDINLKLIGTIINQLTESVLQNQKMFKLVITCAYEMIECAPTTAELFIGTGISFTKALSLNKIDGVELLVLHAKFIAKSSSAFEARDAYGKNGVITVLFNSIKRSPNNQELNENICAAYQSLVYQHTENSIRLLTSPAISHIKSLISSSNQESSLFKNICGLIDTLLHNSEAPSVLVNEGILDELFSVLRNGSVQCLGTLEKFTKEPIVITSVIEKGYIKIALDFIKKHMDTVEVVGSMLPIIKNIVSGGKDKATFKSYSRETVPLLLSLLPAYELNGEFVSLQLGILVEMSRFSENAKLITCHKGLPKVLEILKIYDFDRNIVAKCLEIARETLPYEQNIEIIATCESVQILNSLILLHKEADHILLIIFKVLNQCLTGPDKCQKLYELGSLKACLLASEESVFQQDTAMEFLKLLTKVAIVEDIATFICETGGIIVLNKIKENVQYPKIMDIGLRLLMSLVTVESNLDILLDNGMLDTLYSIVELHSLDEDIITQAVRLIYLVETGADVSHKEQIKSNVGSILQMCPRGDEIHRTLKLKQRGTTTPEFKYSYKKSNINSSYKDQERLTPLKERTMNTENKLQSLNKSDIKRKHEESDNKILSKDTANIDQEIELLSQGRSVKIWLPNGDTQFMVLRLSSDKSEICAQVEDRPAEKRFKMELSEIQEVKKGYDSSSMKNSEKLPNKELCFSIIGKPEKCGQKTIHVECLIPDDCEKLVEQIKKLATI